MIALSGGSVGPVYLSGAIACLGNATSVLCRSQITKLIDPLEVGKLFSFLGAMQVK